MKGPYSLDKSHSLKSRKQIELLFSDGLTAKKYPIVAKFIFEKNDSNFTYKIGFSVSKKKFKRAVDRNRIKRQMREAFRNNKALLINTLMEKNLKLTLMFIYTGKELVETSSVIQNISLINARVSEQISRKNASIGSGEKSSKLSQ